MEAEIDWKAKYLQLENKMSHFHSQASDIRNKLAVKIDSLTIDCKSATERAEKAEEEIRKLKKKLGLLQDTKDEEITGLQNKLEISVRTENALNAEIEQRNEEQSLVHQKIIKLKGWISAKLEEVEDQKKQLFEANRRAAISLYEMKIRVQELTAENENLKQTGFSPNRKKHETITSDDISIDSSMTSTSPLPSSHTMDISSSPPPVPPHKDKNEQNKSPSHTKHNNNHYREVSPTNTPQVLPHLSEDNSWAHDSSSASTSETISHISIDSENKKDLKSRHGGGKRTGHKSSEITVDIVLDHRVPNDPILSPKWVVDNKKSKKKSATLPKTRSVNKKDQSSTPHHSSLIETFGSITRKFRGFTDSHQHSSPTRGLRRTQSAGKKESKSHVSRSSTKNSSKHVSTPMPDLITKEFVKSKSSGQSGLDDSLQEVEEENLSNKSEKMEITENKSAPASGYFSTSLPSPMLAAVLPRTKRSQSMRTTRKRPPTPPLHQVPTWETKIYNLTKNGFQLRASEVARNYISRASQISVCYHSTKERASALYKKLEPDVPVYTKVFGKILLLRRDAFTEATDSSDDEFSSSVASELSHLKNMSSSGNVQYSYTLPLRRNGSPGQSRAIKRANSAHSITSSEGDYSIPPDAISLCSDSSEPEHKLYKTGRTGAPAAASSRVNSSCSTSPENGTSPLLSPANLQQPSLVQDKCGFLSKLSGCSRTWQKRWFVLKPGKLQYYFSPNDVTRKPLGEILLNNETSFKIESGDDCHPIFEISNEKKVIYISADTYYAAEDWLRALNISLNRPRTLGLRKAGRYRSITENKITLKGWLERSSKDGKHRKLWTCLGTSSLYFYNDDKEKEFVGRMGLKDCAIEPLDDENSVCVKFPTSRSRQRADVYLTYTTKMEKDAWLYWLTIASGSLSLSLSGTHTTESSIGTQYERLVTRMMYVAMCTADNKEDSIPVAAASPLWRNQILSFNRDAPAQPLTTLSSKALHTEAVKMIKICQLFMNIELDSASVDYHVTLAQRTASTCLTHQQLQGEIYSQLIKQCNGKIAKQNSSSISPKHNNMTKIKTSTVTDDETAVLQVWKLLALIVPLFLPHHRLLWFLKAHLQRHADDKDEIGQYAIYCHRALGRALTCGRRTSPPSRTETISILLQNPYQHSLPFSIPVHFCNGKYEVVSYDASTGVEEFTKRACQQAGLRSSAFSGFALFTEDPLDDSNTNHLVSTNSKICDIISEWERTYRETSSNKVIDSSRMVKVTLCQHLFLASNQDGETEKEKILIAYQVADEIASDRFPVTRELAIELSSICAQMHEGDMRTADHSIKDILEKFYPRRYIDNANKQQLRQLRAKLCEKWTMLKNTSPSECARVILATTRKFTLYGAKLFQVEVNRKHNKLSTIWLAVHEHGVNELNYVTMAIENTYKYLNIMTYGGCDNRFMIVVEKEGVPEKHFYSMSKEKASEIVHLMTEYMKVFTAKKRYIP
uniref:pleckstrin homology domain-containing family H member 1-like n=1 Tax=Styela clava TaxID=7725 RepID=UPI00193A3476|nr:pleckstrin homology domain-containing family H member 1-like [Styela clava]